MDLKKFVMSGIQDVLTDKVSKFTGSKGQQQPQQQPDQSSNYNQANSNYNQGGQGYTPNQGSSYPQSGGSYNQDYQYQQQQQPQQPGMYGGGGQGYNPYGGQPNPNQYPSGGAGYPGGGPQEMPYPGSGAEPKAAKGLYFASIQPMNMGGANSKESESDSDSVVFVPLERESAPPIGFNTQGGAGYPPVGGAGYPGAAAPGYPQGGPGYQQPGGGYPGQNYSQQGYPQQQPPTSYPPQQGYGTPQQQGGGLFGGGYGGVVTSQAHYSVPGMLGRPSIIPVAGFNANQDAEALRKAMKGLGCNNSKVIAVLCARTNWQRQEIAKAFKVMYGKDLLKDLKSELSGDFEDLILALMEPAAVYDAKQLRKAMEGLGTKESVLIEIMTSRTNQQIAEIRTVYRQLFGRDLEKELVGETSGCFKRLLVSLCAGGRDEGNYMDPLRANQDARRLHSAGERRLGTDESTFNAVLASQNYSQLRMVFDEYQKVSNHSIEKAIESEFSGDIRDGLLAVIQVVRNRPAYFAKLLHASMKGLGTRDNDLIRLVVTRCEYDMADIRNEFQNLFKTSLESMIKGDCSGAYKDGLIALVKGNM